MIRLVIRIIIKFQKLIMRNKNKNKNCEKKKYRKKSLHNEEINDKISILYYFIIKSKKLK